MHHIFKAGDRVICIDDSSMGLITNGKVYVIEEILKYDKIRILSDNNTEGVYSETRFVSILTNRNMVIDNILM